MNCSQLLSVFSFFLPVCQLTERSRVNWFPPTIFASDRWKEARRQQIEPGIEYGGHSKVSHKSLKWAQCACTDAMDAHEALA